MSESWTGVIDDINDAIKSGLLVQPDGLSGYSGDALMGSLQRVAARQAANGVGDYLEVGVFQGLTLLSVAAATTGAAYGIDNFAQFDQNGENKGLVEARQNHNKLENAYLINEDYEDALETLASHIGDGPIGTYFVDGPHDYRSQLICLMLALPHLAQGAVVFVDDCNYRHVRLANRDFLVTNPDWALLFEAYTEAHPKNTAGQAAEAARSGWWNGVNIMVHDPERSLPRILPPTLRNRLMAENEHVVQASRYGAIAPEAMMVIDAALSGQDTNGVLSYLQQRLAATPQPLLGMYPAMNTWSAGLTSGRFATDQPS
jgi:hypothetical protein